MYEQLYFLKFFKVFIFFYDIFLGPVNSGFDIVPDMQRHTFIPKRLNA